MSKKRPYQKPKITPSKGRLDPHQHQLDPQEYWDGIHDVLIYGWAPHTIAAFSSPQREATHLARKLSQWLSSGGYYPVVIRPKSVLDDKISNRVYVRTVIAFLLQLEEGV